MFDKLSRATENQQGIREGASPGKRTLTETLGVGASGGRPRSAHEALIADQGRGGALPLLEGHAAALAAPAHAHLATEATPLLDEGRSLATAPRRAAVEGLDPDDQRMVEVLVRLDAIFSLHLPASATAAPASKERSVARHAELGEEAVAAMLAVPAEGATPGQVLADRQSIAAELETRLSAALEEPVRLRVHLPPGSEVEQSGTLVVEVVVAPNDWWAELIITGAVITLATGALVWRWCVRRGRTGDTPHADKPKPKVDDPPKDGTPKPPVSDGARDGTGSAAVKEAVKDGAKDGAKAGVDPAHGAAAMVPLPLAIQGLPNQRNDCFLNSVLQLLSASYPDLLDADKNLDVDLRSYLRRFVAAQVNPMHLPPLRAPLLGVPDPDYANLADVAVPIANPGVDNRRAHALAELQRIRGAVGTHRRIRGDLAALLDRIRHPELPIDAQAVKQFRALLLQNRPRLVESLNAQEDAQELLNGLLDELLATGGGHRIGMHQTLTIQAETPRAQVPGALGAPPAHPMDYGADGVFAHDVEPETMLKVPIDGRFAGLLEYLRAAFGVGTDEASALGSEWARHGGQVVAVTQRRVAQQFTALPDVLTIMLQRAREGHAKRDDAFRMPTSLTLVEHPDGVDPRARTYELKSFVFHSGPSARGGHYWAHTHDEMDGWMQADDRRVTTDRQSAAPDEHDLQHDIDHGYIYAYVLSEDQPVDLPADGIADGDFLVAQDLPAALPALARPGARQARPQPSASKAASSKASSQTSGPKGKDAETPAVGEAPSVPKTIVQCGNMTGDMFIICAALRLDPTLKVRVIWDEVYYLETYRAQAEAEGTTVVELFNRNLPVEKRKDEQGVADVLRARMRNNAENMIRPFYLSAGIAEDRILVEQSDPKAFPKGAYEDEFAHVKQAVHPKDGSAPQPGLAVPGYATSTVQHAFEQDRVGAQDVIAGMFDRLDEGTRAKVDKFRKEKVGDQKVVLLWSRGSSRNPGGGNPGLDSDPNVLEQLVSMVRGRTLEEDAPTDGDGFPDRAPWIIGDPVPDATPALAGWIKNHSLVEYWTQIGGLSYLGQMYFLDQLHRHNEAIAVGMISGVLEMPALLGMPTFYFELSFMREKGKRWAKMSGTQRPRGGAVGNLNQLELGVDQEYSANLRGLLRKVSAWLDTRDVDEARRLDAQTTRWILDNVLELGYAPEGGPPARFDPDEEDPRVRKGRLARLEEASRWFEAWRAFGAPAVLSKDDRQEVSDLFLAMREQFAMSPDELGDLESLMRTWFRSEELDRVRAAQIGTSDDAQLVQQLRRLAPQADLVDHGASVTLGGSITLAYADLRDRMARDPSWVMKHLKVDRSRTLLADEPLRLDNDGKAALVKAKSWTEAAAAHEQLEALLAVLGERAFAGLVADSTANPSGLLDLLPFIDPKVLPPVVARVGADVLAGMIVEFRGSPGRYQVFVDGVRARGDALAPPIVEDGGLDGDLILHSRLAMPMHRAALAQDDAAQSLGEKEPTVSRELALRPRTPIEQSQADRVSQVVAEDHPAVRASGLAHGLGGGRSLQVGDARPWVEDGEHTQPQDLGVLPVTAQDRESPAFTKILEAVYALQIRGAGRAQLAELAEVFLAAQVTRSRPRFATAHNGMIDALGLAAGYPMAERRRTEPYARFIADHNIARAKEADDFEVEKPGQIGPDHPSFAVTLAGVTIDVEPIDTVQFSRPAPVTGVGQLAARSKEPGVRLHERSRVVCTLLESSRGTGLPDRIEGTVAGYTADNELLVVDAEQHRHRVLPDAYEITLTDGKDPRLAYHSHTLDEVQKLFPDTKDVTGKLQALAGRTVAREVEGIEKFTVGDYVKVITDAGFDVYVVGGAVRDIVSGKKDPSDIDLATTMPAIDAMSGFESRRLADRQGQGNLPSARVIPAHGIAQVEHQVESGLDVVSLHSSEHGVCSMDLVTDAGNRDFTINTLFYDPRTERVIDPTGFGLADLKGNVLRWTCFASDDAIRAKLRADSYQVGRWLKFRVKGMVPAKQSDVAIVNQILDEHLAAGLTPEEKARILDGIGKPLPEVVARAAELGVPEDRLRALAPG